jgi:flagellum-specific peptidoglycan hydrolase FlgJ
VNAWIWLAAGTGAWLLGEQIARTGQAGFLDQVRAAALAVAPHLGVGAQQIVAAHAALESGWGASKPAKLGFNIFNVTRPRSDSRPIIESGDLECNDSGVCAPVVQRFAKYSSLSEALAEYFRLLSTPRYAVALGRLEAGDSTGFVSELRRGGYFTLPLEEYQRRFSGVLSSVQARWA